MSKATHTHAMLLAMQLASIFKYVADDGHHREIYKTFQPLEGDLIVFEYDEHWPRKGRASVDVLIKTDRNQFLIRQLFNFGIQLEIELSYYKPDGSLNSLMSNFLDAEDGDSETAQLMIDFEYAISILTEHVAAQLNRLN